MTITGGRHTILPDDIDCYVDLEVGAFTSIASGLKIVSGQHPPVDHPDAVSNFPFLEQGWGDYPPCQSYGKVVIGNDVWVGQDVSILDGVIVGHGATLAACSVVTRDVAPYALVAGNPATIKKMRFSKGVVTDLLSLAWWEWDDATIRAALPKMAHVHSLLTRMEA